MIKSTANERNLRGDILFFFGIILVGYLAWLARDLLVLLYISALFAAVFMPVVRFVGHIRIGPWQPFRGFAVLFLLLFIAGALTGFGFLAIPPVVRDLQSIGTEGPGKLPALVMKVENLPFVDQLNTGEIGARIQGFLSQAATQLLLSIQRWAGDLLDIITGVVLTIYFILDGKHAYRWFLSFVEPVRRERLDKALGRADQRMGKWLLGQGSLMLILGIVSTFVYLSLHVRYPYALGVLTGLLNIVPVLGAAVSFVLAVLVAALNSWETMLGVAIFFAVYIWLENWFLVPRIMRNSVDLPALGILVSLLLGFTLEGIPGALVAIPTAVLVTVLLDEYFVYKDQDDATNQAREQTEARPASRR
jgi:predicted PurR-regulated permease PerM